jgi:hypothetical protein
MDITCGNEEFLPDLFVTLDEYKSTHNVPGIDMKKLMTDTDDLREESVIDILMPKFLKRVFQGVSSNDEVNEILHKFTYSGGQHGLVSIHEWWNDDAIVKSPQ